MGRIKVFVKDEFYPKYDSNGYLFILINFIKYMKLKKHFIKAVKVAKILNDILNL